MRRANGQDQVSAQESPFDLMSLEEYEQFKVDNMNKLQGDLNDRDGYECPFCLNKGVIYERVENNGNRYTTALDCKCAPIRRSIMRMKRSGLKDVIKNCTFEKWIASEDWQKATKQAAQDFAKAPQGWFFIGGQSGCGKTHLCTAICRDLLLSGQEVQYMQWRDEVVRLKGRELAHDQRESIINAFKKAKVLYIDDLFKTGKNPDGSEQRPTSADINIAFELLNYRYNNPDMITIISSEFPMLGLLEIDEAIGGRINERTQGKALSIAKDGAKNYRTKNMIIL